MKTGDAQGQSTSHGDVREYSSLTFKKSELVSFPGAGPASTITATKGFRISRRASDDFVLVESEGVEYEVAMSVVGVLTRKVRQ